MAHPAATSTGQSAGWTLVVAAALAAIPGIVLALGPFDASDPVRAVVYGIAIVGAAFLLSWAAEAVQLDFSQGLALALLALIAILPEYVVDASFAWLAAENPAYAGYAIANMTGANRLLIGIAWPMVIAIAYLRHEFVVVALFAWRGESTPALGTLVSSKINQWTLLVAMLPLVYSVALGRPDALPLDQRQQEEVLLTAAQSLFAVALLLDLRLSLIGAGALFVLFIIQMIFPETRTALTIVYGVLTVVALVISRRHLGRAFSWLRPPAKT